MATPAPNTRTGISNTNDRLITQPRPWDKPLFARRLWFSVGFCAIYILYSNVYFYMTRLLTFNRTGHNYTMVLYIFCHICQMFLMLCVTCSVRSLVLLSWLLFTGVLSELQRSLIGFVLFISGNDNRSMSQPVLIFYSFSYSKPTIKPGLNQKFKYTPKYCNCCFQFQNRCLIAHLRCTFNLFQSFTQAFLAFLFKLMPTCLLKRWL